MANGDLHAVRDYDTNRLVVLRERALYVDGNSAIVIEGQDCKVSLFDAATYKVVYDGPIPPTGTPGRR